MKNGVLIAYATKYGSTREVAQRIGNVFNEEGMGVDVRDVKEIKKNGWVQGGDTGRSGPHEQVTPGGN